MWDSRGVRVDARRPGAAPRKIQARCASSPLRCLTMDRRTFRSELARLKSAARQRGNLDCFESGGCDNCSRCMFCTGCTDCHACTYCTDCTGCTGLVHSQGCQGCHRGSHLQSCLRCVDSRYLVECVDCAECTYCFGCVGLLGKEFHILNEPYDRKTYFAMVKALKAELGL